MLPDIREAFGEDMGWQAFERMSSVWATCPLLQRVYKKNPSVTN